MPQLDTDFTPIQGRLLRLLGDGKRHSTKQVMAECLLSARRNTLHFHLTELRKRLRRIDLCLDVIAMRDDDEHEYQLVRVVPITLGEIGIKVGPVS